MRRREFAAGDDLVWDSARNRALVAGSLAYGRAGLGPSIADAPPSTPLVKIKPLRLVFAHLNTPEKEILELFDKYNLLSLPVIDEDYLLSGVITADDIISVLRDHK